MYAALASDVHLRFSPLRSLIHLLSYSRLLHASKKKAGVVALSIQGEHASKEEGRKKEGRKRKKEEKKEKKKAGQCSFPSPGKEKRGRPLFYIARYDSEGREEEERGPGASFAMIVYCSGAHANMRRENYYGSL